MRKTLTIFCKGRDSETATGVEIAADTTQRGKNKILSGRAYLRFFKTTGEKNHFRFMVDPWQCYEIYMLMMKVYKSTGSHKEIIEHKFKAEDGAENTTKFTIERWERNGRSGLALVGARGKLFHNVGVSEPARFLHAAEFLKYLSCVQCWRATPEGNIGSLTIYCKKGENEPSTGMEICSMTKDTDDGQAGRIGLRFFSTAGSSNQIKFTAEPWEALEIAARMQRAYKSPVGTKEKFTHKWEKDGKTVTTNLVVERWERGGEGGLSLLAGRGEQFHNVGISDIAQFLHAAEFLRFLATKQCWEIKTAA